MEDIDKENFAAHDHWHDDEEELLHQHVIQGDHLMLYLDTYLREMMRG